MLPSPTACSRHRKHTGDMRARARARQARWPFCQCTSHVSRLRTRTGTRGAAARLRPRLWLQRGCGHGGCGSVPLAKRGDEDASATTWQSVATRCLRQCASVAKRSDEDEACASAPASSPRPAPASSVQRMRQRPAGVQAGQQAAGHLTRNSAMDDSIGGRRLLRRYRPQSAVSSSTL